jgi:hypothetical protein
MGPPHGLGAGRGMIAPDRGSPRRHGSRAVAVLIASACCVAALSGTWTAFAHVPALETSATSDGTTPLGSPDVSRAIYGYIAPGEERDSYSFSVASPVTTTLGVIVPAYPEQRGFRPSLVLEDDRGSSVTIGDPGLDPRAKEWEPFSLTSFWKGGERSVSFEPGHRYTLRVVPGADTPFGRYVIVVGGAERFTGADTLGTLRDLPAIWVGMYGGAPFRFNPWALIPVAFVLVLLLAAVFAAIRGARMSRQV